MPRASSAATRRLSTSMACSRANCLLKKTRLKAWLTRSQARPPSLAFYVINVQLSAFQFHGEVPVAKGDRL